MDIWEVIAQQRREGIDCVVITILAVRGSVPGVAGAKALVTEHGIVAGTLGGGKVEAKAVAVARGLLKSSGGCTEHTWNLQHDVGMTCGGEMRFLFEALPSESTWHVVVFGAGHVAQALVSVLARLSCRVDVIDPRGDWLEMIQQSGNVACHRIEYVDGVKFMTDCSMVTCLSQGHSTDRPVISAVLKQHPDVRFLGVIGSASKRAVLARELREDGVSDELIQRIVCPIGLPIGSNAPAEIAISIAAQLLEVRDR